MTAARLYPLMSTFFAFVLTLAMLGCKRGAEKPSAGIKVGTVSKLIEEMTPDEVIVSVNGVILTRENLDDAMDMKEALYIRGKSSATKQELKMLRPYWISDYLQEFISRQLVLQEARAKKHQPSQVAVRVSRQDMSKVMHVQEEALDRTFTELGRVGRSLKAVMEENALMRSFREAEYAEALKVLPEDVEKRIVEIKAYHARAEATNQWVIAQGRTLYEQLKQGEDFLKLAARYSEAEDRPKGEWGEFLKGQIENAQLREAAFSLPVGEVSEPFDTEDGLVILKIFERHVETLGPAVVPGPGTVKLGRIVLRMAQGGAGAKLPTREQVEKAVATQKVKDLQQSWIPSLGAKALIAYPNGTNLWSTAKAKKPARPRLGFTGLSAKEETK